jgi:hypothetical protein
MINKETLIEMAGQFAAKFGNGAEFDEEFVYADNGKNEVFEDDATIHVRINGTRVCIGFDQFKTKQSVIDRAEKAANKFFGFGA